MRKEEKKGFLWEMCAVQDVQVDLFYTCAQYQCLFSEINRKRK